MFALVSIINVYIEFGMYFAFLNETVEMISTEFNFVNVLVIVL